MKICPVILSGGSGTRLWPVSRSSYPKQFLDLSGKGSLFLQTLNRCINFEAEIQTPIVVSNEDHRFIIAQQIRESSIENADIILEPSGKNTAPAITLAAMHLERVIEEDCLMLVMPADHIIQPQEEFLTCINSSIEQAALGAVCTFGILPTKPHTGYGYIEAEMADLSSGIHTVNSFIEKPDLAKANKFIKNGNYFWNSGIYLLKLSVFISAMDELAPEIIKYCSKAMKDTIHDSDFIRPDAEEFSSCPSISVDHALMEKIIDKGVPVKVSNLIAEWNDIGSLSSLSDILPKDEGGNGVRGDVLSIDTKNSLLFSSDGLLTSIGLQDMLVVKTADAVLVAPKDRDQEIKEIVKKLQFLGREEAVLHNEVHRPWGTYKVLHESDGFKVKSIKVYPRSQLSLQMHKKRSEHWVVVDGTATVRSGDETFDLKENESTFIPSTTKHSLANNTDSLLEIVEVQTGSYLGEDDIIRFEDKYGRVK